MLYQEIKCHKRKIGPQGNFIKVYKRQLQKLHYLVGRNNNFESRSKFYFDQVDACSLFYFLNSSGYATRGLIGWKQKSKFIAFYKGFEKIYNKWKIWNGNMKAWIRKRIIITWASTLCRNFAYYLIKTLSSITILRLVGNPVLNSW